MIKHRARAVFLIVFAALVGYFVYVSEVPEGQNRFRLGLDLSGGTHLVYQADVSRIDSAQIPDAMLSLRDLVERRVNVFGVSEPLVQTQEATALSSEESAYKLIVELPGVTDIDEAVRSIGATPSLDFRLITAEDMEFFQTSIDAFASTTEQQAQYLALFKPTGLNGSMVSDAMLDFNPTTNQPAVALTFNNEGRDLFANITKDNIGNYLGIFLDGSPISVPIVQDQIVDGRAQISGAFTVEEANLLVRDLRFGALPVPISLISTQTIGPSLGQVAVQGGIKAGIVSFIIIAVFLIIWYRLPGLIATIALAIYIVLNLAIFKLGVSPIVIMICALFIVLALKWHWTFGLIAIAIYASMSMIEGAMSPVTLTAAGIAAFILSIGMAVDANILIFERMKEELAKGRGIWESMHEGFERAWLSIRDSNTSSLITGAILYFVSSTSVITGFALVFIIGVLVSMFTAITASRLLLYAIAPKGNSKSTIFLFKNGFKLGASDTNNKS